MNGNLVITKAGMEMMTVGMTPVNSFGVDMPHTPLPALEHGLPTYSSYTQGRHVVMHDAHRSAYHALLREATLSQSGDARLTILIIDDDAVTAHRLSRMLQAEGFHPLIASTGPEGRRLAEEVMPHLILLDIELPGEDGFTTCVTLKENSYTSDIPVIFLTSSDTPKDKVRGLTIGGVDFIVKPPLRQELIARIQIHLRLAAYAHLLVDAQVARFNEMRQFQTAMLVQSEELPEAKFSVWYHPLHAIGGDFYDVVALPNGVYGYLLADISGHDIDVAFFTSALKALFRQNCTLLHTPYELMHVMNDVLLSVLQPEQFITACYAHLNRWTNTLKIISAGHPPMLFARLGEPIRLLGGEGDVLGAFEAVTFHVDEISVQPGDRFYIYSDGITETATTVKDAPGMSEISLGDQLASLSSYTLDATVSELATPYLRNPQEQLDDQVILAVEV